MSSTFYENKFIKKVEDDGFFVLGSYLNAKTKVLCYHPTCKESVFIIPDAFINRGSYCGSVLCRNKRRNKTIRNKGIKRLDKILLDSEYEWVDGDFIDAVTKIKLSNLNCSHPPFWVAPRHFLNSGSRCPLCSTTFKKDTEYFREEVKEVTDGEYIVLDEYKTKKIPLRIKHIPCGLVREYIPDSFLNANVRCNKCLWFGSYGETYIKRLLDSLCINYHPQKTFKGCKDKYVLRFDFAVLDDFDNVLFLIEYQGKQHYEPVEFFGGVDNFEEVKRRDGIKRDYCEANNIPLLLINYQIPEKEIKGLILNKLNEERCNEGKKEIS